MMLQTSHTAACGPLSPSRNFFSSSGGHSRSTRPKAISMYSMPVLGGLFGGVANAVKHFDIRLDKNIVVFRGDASEASGQTLKGKVVLCLVDAIQVKRVHLTLKGSYKIGLPPVINGHTRYMTREITFHQDIVDLIGSSTTDGSEKLGAGNYEWDFEFVLEGSLPESVEGIPTSWSIYRLKAAIETKGKYAKDVFARKHVRVVRTLGPSALDMSHMMSVANTWPGKVRYTFNTPSKAAIMGSTVELNIVLVSLLKGMKFGRIKSTIEESRGFTIFPRGALLDETKVIAEETCTVPEDMATVSEENGDEAHVFKRYLQLPTNLSKCLQDVFVHGSLRVRHRITFKVELFNPDGHISELRAVLPLKIFISPNMPIDETNNVILSSQNYSPNSLVERPPGYGEHVFDQLWSEVNPDGFITPARSSSAVASPSSSASRSHSFENLASLVPAYDDGSAHPRALQQRLNRLDIQNPNSSLPSRRSQLNQPPQSSRPPLTVGSNTPPTSTIPEESENSSESEDDFHDARSHSVASTESGSPSHRHVETFDVLAMSRVPSYDTALHAPANTQIETSLPNYQSATSAPSTPPLATGQRARFSQSDSGPSLHVRPF